MAKTEKNQAKNIACCCVDDIVEKTMPRPSVVIKYKNASANSADASTVHTTPLARHRKRLGLREKPPELIVLLDRFFIVIAHFQDGFDCDRILFSSGYR